MLPRILSTLSMLTYHWSRYVFLSRRVLLACRKGRGDERTHDTNNMNAKIPCKWNVVGSFSSQKYSHCRKLEEVCFQMAV